MRRLLLVLTLALLAFALPARAQAAPGPCFGAPADYVAQFGSEFPEPRVYVNKQSWWLEGPGDATVDIDAAHRATHLHDESCFPIGELWNEAGGTLRLPVAARVHEYQGGFVKSVQGLGFLESPIVVGFNPVWRPAVDNETRYVTLVQQSSKLKKCGRRENRGHVNGISPNGGEEHFSSYGLQSDLACTAGRTLKNERTYGMIFRSWYQGVAYGNLSYTDDNRSSLVGFHASTMDDPIPANYQIKISLASGANKWLVAVDMDIHGNNGPPSYGLVVARGSGTSATVTLPNVLAPGVHRLAAVGCEFAPKSSPNPVGGQSCGVGVIPILVG